MRVVMGVFHTIEGAEDTVKALLDARFNDDDIGVVVHDSQKGVIIADDLGREYASGATPRDADVISRSTVWDRFPEGYHEYLHREGWHMRREDQRMHLETMQEHPEAMQEQPEGLHMYSDAMTYYQQRLDAGDIIMIINAANRREDVVRIVREHQGELYHGERTSHAEPHVERDKGTDWHEKRGKDEAA